MLFGAAARGLTAASEGQVAENIHGYERRALRRLLAYWSLSEIDIEAVDRYRHHKVKEAEARKDAIECHQPRFSKLGLGCRFQSGSPPTS